MKVRSITKYEIAISMYIYLVLSQPNELIYCYRFNIYDNCIKTYEKYEDRKVDPVR